jgi:RND family efflux transporter MFP subunit
MKPALLPIVVLTALAAAACGKKAADAGPEKPQGEVAATVAPAEAGRFVETVDAVGSVVPRMGHVASLAAPAPTRVMTVFVSAGARVNKGDQLVELEQAPFESALRSADAALATAQKAAARAKLLADSGVSARRDAEVAASELAQAQATQAAAKLALDRSTLRAPIAGVVTRMSAVLGANVDPSQPLVEVADPSALDAALTLSPGDAARVHIGQGVALHEGADASGKPIAGGRVSDVSAAVDTTSRGILARVEITSIAEHANAVMVPIVALVPTGEGYKVFVVNDQDIAMSREVKIGGRNDKGAWVTEGLKAGEKIVTAGAYGVDDSTKIVKPGEAGSKKAGGEAKGADAKGGDAKGGDAKGGDAKAPEAAEKAAPAKKGDAEEKGPAKKGDAEEKASAKKGDAEEKAPPKKADAAGKKP